MAERARARRIRAPFVRASIALHLAGAGACVVAPRAWPLALGAVVADHALLVAGSLWPRSSLVGPNLCRLPPSAPADAVALTFDDGPDPCTTPAVLDRLAAHGAQASFFCIGLRAEAHPDVVAEIRRRGHAVENHSFAHWPGFCLLGPRALGRDLDRAQETLARLAGAPPRHFRAPAGLRNPWLDAALVRRGLDLVTWTRRGFDTVVVDPRRIARRLCDGLRPRDVLVLHDGGAERAVVLEALARVLDEMARRGLRSIALPRPAGANGAE